jgi:carboxyl-terminal processing protease
MVAITVISPLKDTPAEKAGIKAGDIILKIDEKQL